MKTALALCGGGSLGAYEMGVWKYLREHSYDFDIVTGTSIGAINGAMIATNQYDVAMDMWNSVKVGDIMAGGLDFDRTFLKNIDVSRGSKWNEFIGTFMKNKGADTRPLRRMLEEKIAPLHVNRGPKKFGVVTCHFPSFKEVDVLVNDLNDDQVIDYLMASASCWPVFPVYQMNDQEYVDGGWRNNLPIDFALRLGADKVIAVLLNSLPRAQKRELFDLPNVTLIQPSLPQGSFLAFTHNAIESNMKMGYLDTAKVFGTLKGNRVTLENDPEFKELCSRYFRVYLDHEPNDFLKVAQHQRSRLILPIRDEIERSFIIALEAFMDIYGLDFHTTYHIQEIMTALKEKIRTETRGAKAKRILLYLSSGDIPRLVGSKELWYFAQILK